MTPHDTIKVKLPYPVGFLTIPRKIGFLFTNLSVFLFREHEDIKTSKDYQEWTDKHGENGLVNVMIYYSAMAYCLQNKCKENFTREGLSKAIALASDEKKEAILKVWKASETFGATVKTSKKKVTKKK